MNRYIFSHYDWSEDTCMDYMYEIKDKGEYTLIKYCQSFKCILKRRI